MTTTVGNKAVVRDRYRLCPHCGDFSHFDQGQRFCMRCGTKMLEECLQCHEPIIYPTARCCPACGEPLVEGDGNFNSGVTNL